MQINRRLLVLIILLVSVAVPAQPDEDANKEKRARLFAVLEESLADVQNLRLPENRAVFYARIGNLMWPLDEKRAHSLFLNSATELVNAQTLAESKRATNPYNELLQSGNTRQHILNLIAQRDAELALDLLVKTRPAAVQRVMETTPEKKAKISNFHQNYGYLGQNETYMEQNFYRMAAEQSPERAVRILKESLTKGLSNDTFNQLTRLAEKDLTAAAEMGSHVIDKLVRSSYMMEEQPNYQNIQLTQSILNHHMARQNGDGTKLKFDDAQIRSLAAKFVSTYLTDQRVSGAIGDNVRNIAEKFQPSALEQIKKVSARLNPINGVVEVDAAYQKLIQSETPVEQMLAEADKFPMNSRRQIYQTASNKLMAQGDWQGAREILTENFAEDDGDQTITNFDQQLVWNFINQSKFTEAERAIELLPEQFRVGLLVNLSNSVYGRDPKENKAYALALLGKARQLTNERPENSNEMSMLMQVIGGYSQVDPAEAIRLYEGIVPKVMELTDAAAVLNGFQVNSNIREGEFLILHGDPINQYGGNSSMIGAFSRFDFDRTMNLIDSFSRKELRTSLRLQLLEGSEITQMSATTKPSMIRTQIRRGDK
jgi:hypothetical protein